MTTQEGLPALATDDVIDEVQRRLDTFHLPSFDREIVEQLLALARRSAATAEPAVAAAWGYYDKLPGRAGETVLRCVTQKDRADDLREAGVEVFPLYASTPLRQAMVNRATVSLINEFGGEFPYGEAKEIVELILNAALSPAPAPDAVVSEVMVEKTDVYQRGYYAGRDAGIAIERHAQKTRAAATNESTGNPDDVDEAYELGKRDGYEDAIQDLDLATGGDGEFRGSTFPGATVDVPAMRRRIIDRCAALSKGK